MCVIVDASVSVDFFGLEDDELLPLWKWIDDGGAALVVGGKLTTELYRVNSARDQIQAWRQAGLVHRERKETVDAEASAIQGRCKSNDSHVIALARVSDARLLCADDGNLERDFRNPDLINNPRGSVYKNRSHRHLLGHRGQCPHRPGKE